MCPRLRQEGAVVWGGGAVRGLRWVPRGSRWTMTEEEAETNDQFGTRLE